MEPQTSNPSPVTPQQATGSVSQPVAQATVQKPLATLPKDQTKSNRKLVLGCLTAFGCSLFLFIGILFAFLFFGSETSPLFSRLGVPSGDVVNVLITLVNLIFLVLVFAAFIFTVIGVFRIATAKKDDKEARGKAAIFTFASLVALGVLIMLWIFAYFFLSQKRTTAPLIAIATEPEKTINLTAPITIKFDASKAPVNKRQYDILSYEWDFGDKTVLRGNPQTHTFSALGNFKVNLTIIAKEKRSGEEKEFSFTRDVTIQNVLANVVIKADTTKGPAPLTVNLDGSSSRSVNGEITSFEWDLNGDSKFDDASGAKTQATFDKIGVYRVSLRVQDSTGAFATGEVTIEATVPDTPTAVIKVEGVDGTNLETNQSYVFSAAESSSPSGNIEKYRWDFGDGATATTRTATHTYRNHGEYEVTLMVTDSAKKEGQLATRFTVGQRPAAPLLSFKTTPQHEDNILSGKAPFEVIFDASESQDETSPIVDYAWDFDGNDEIDDTEPVTSHTYETAGTFNAKLTVTNAANLSTTFQIVVKVLPAGLKADIKAEPISGITPLTVKFDASGSSNSEGNIVSYEWDFGDGTAPRLESAKVSHQYTAVGTFTAKVTAISSDHKRDTAQIPITVRTVPLQACFETTTTSGKAPLEVQFDPTCSTGTVVKYRWNFANLSQSTDRKPVFTFQDPGEYSVTLEVSDAENLVDSFTKKIITTP